MNSALIKISYQILCLLINPLRFMMQVSILNPAVTQPPD